MPLTIVSPTTPEVYLHGVSARLVFTTGGGTPVNTAFPIEQVQFEHQVDLDPITHSEAGGWEVLLEGIQRASLEITFVYDLSNRPTMTPFQVMAAKTAQVHLILDANPTPNNPSPTLSEDFNGVVKVANVKFPTGPKAGPVRCVASCKSSGVFNLPTS